MSKTYNTKHEYLERMKVEFPNGLPAETHKCFNDETIVTRKEIKPGETGTTDWSHSVWENGDWRKAEKEAQMATSRHPNGKRKKSSLTKEFKGKKYFTINKRTINRFGPHNRTSKCHNNRNTKRGVSRTIRCTQREMVRKIIDDGINEINENNKK